MRLLAAVLCAVMAAVCAVEDMPDYFPRGEKMPAYMIEEEGQHQLKALEILPNEVKPALIFESPDNGEETKETGCLNRICRNFCPDGYQIGENGCQTCKCMDLVPPMCYLACPNGFVQEAGKPQCRCKPECPRRPCPKIYCPNGHFVDEDGCETCACKEAVPEVVPRQCRMLCPYGFVEEEGRPICKCKERVEPVEPVEPTPASEREEQGAKKEKVETVEFEEQEEKEETEEKKGQEEREEKEEKEVKEEESEPVEEIDVTEEGVATTEEADEETTEEDGEELEVEEEDEDEEMLQGEWVKEIEEDDVKGGAQEQSEQSDEGKHGPMMLGHQGEQGGQDHRFGRGGEHGPMLGHRGEHSRQLLGRNWKKMWMMRMRGKQHPGMKWVPKRRGAPGEPERHQRKKPRFCGKHRCPRFWTVAKRRGYEVRCYAPTSWAITKASEVDQKYFKAEFFRLLSYIKGSNKEGKVMPMTVPVSQTMLYNITDHTTKSGLGFYIPTRCNQTAPDPTDSLVKVHNYGKFCVYVRSFGGYSMGRSKLLYKNLYWLSKAIKKSDRAYKAGLSMFAGYNSPRQVFFRHNEVWRVPTKKDNEEYMAMVKDPEFTKSCE